MDSPSPFPSPSSQSESSKSPLTPEQDDVISLEASNLFDPFVKTFMTEFKPLLIRHVKTSLKGKQPSPFKLKDSSEATRPQIVMTGWLTKRGDFFKTWKKRFFVLKSNGTCEYYGKETEGKPKGEIALQGYTINAEPTIEGFNGKHFTMTLEPTEEEGRVWFMFANGEEEKAEWVQALSQATLVATSYVNPDHVVRATFAKSYTQVRRAAGLPAKIPKGQEQDVLAAMFLEILERKLMGDLVRDLEPGAKKPIVKYVRSVAGAKAAATWKLVDQKMQKVKPQIEGVLRKSMVLFVEDEEKVMKGIVSQVGQPILDPVISAVVVPFFSGAVKILYTVLVESYEILLYLSVGAVKVAMADLKDNQKPEDVFEQLEKALNVRKATSLLPYKNLSQWNSQVDELLVLFDKCDDTSGLATDMKKELQEIIKPAATIIFPVSIEDGMVKLAVNTRHTMELDFKERANAEESGKATLAKLHNDMVLYIQDFVRSSLKEFVRKPLEDYLKKHSGEAASALHEEISYDYREILDITSMITGHLESTLDETFNQHAAPLLSKLLNSLNSTLVKAGVRPLS